MKKYTEKEIPGSILPSLKEKLKIFKKQLKVLNPQTFSEITRIYIFGKNEEFYNAGIFAQRILEKYFKNFLILVSYESEFFDSNERFFLNKQTLGIFISDTFNKELIESFIEKNGKILLISPEKGVSNSFFQDTENTPEDTNFVYSIFFIYMISYMLLFENFKTLKKEISDFIKNFKKENLDFHFIKKEKPKSIYILGRDVDYISAREAARIFSRVNKIPSFSYLTDNFLNSSRGENIKADDLVIIISSSKFQKKDYEVFKKLKEKTFSIIIEEEYTNIPTALFVPSINNNFLKLIIMSIIFKNFALNLKEKN